MGGFSGNILGQDVVFAKNLDLTGGSTVQDQLLVNGKFYIASTALNAGGTHCNIGTITSPLGTISIGYSSPNITLDVVSGSSVVETLTGNSGGAISPTSGNINTLGTGSITIAGSGSTLTTQLTGLTNHAVLVGAGTATITKVGPTATAGQVLQSAGSSADPAYSTATYPLTTTINQILYSSAANVISGLATANSAVLATNGSGVPSLTDTPTVTSITFGSGTALSVYQEGTWTPTVVGGSTAGTTTYSIQLGLYRRIGSLVTVWATLTGTGATGTGNAVFGGLPFSTNNTSGYTPTGSFMSQSNASWAWPAGSTNLQVQGAAGSATFTATGTATAGVAGTLQMANAAFSFFVFFSYTV